MPLTARRSESIAAHSQHYNVVLEMRDRGGQVVASDVFVTSKGTDRHVFMVTSPRSAQGPFSWTASVQSSPKTGTLDLQESFEGRERGLDRAPFYPWFSFAFSEFNNARILAEGINREGTYPAINQSAFLVVANPPNPGKFSGFGLVVGTGEWALPADKRRWTNYTFSFDFREKPAALHPRAASQGRRQKMIQFTKPYTPTRMAGTVRRRWRSSLFLREPGVRPESRA